MDLFYAARPAPLTTEIGFIARLPAIRVYFGHGFDCAYCGHIGYYVTYSRTSPVLPTWHPDDGCGLLPLIVWKFRPFVSLQSPSGRFRFLVSTSGTTCLSTLHLRRHSRFSHNDSRPFCFPRSYQDTIIWLMCYYYHSSLLSDAGDPWNINIV